MVLQFPLKNSFCICHYCLCLIASLGIIIFHGLFRKSQKIHILLREISKNKNENNEFFELLKPYKSNMELSKIHKNGISKLKLEIKEILSNLPNIIIDIIISYCYHIKSNIIYYSITKSEIIIMIKYKFKIYSKLIEIYCYIRIIFICLTYIILLYEFIIWYKENKPNFLNGCIGYIFIMIYHPVFKMTIVRIWNGYNGTNVYLPKIVRISISVDTFILLSIEIVHLVVLFISAVIFIIWTIIIVIYFLIQRRIEQPNIQKKIKNKGWIIEEIIYFLKMYISFIVLIISIWFYSVAVVQFFDSTQNWSSSFMFALTAKYCTYFTLNFNDWRYLSLIIAWIMF